MTTITPEAPRKYVGSSVTKLDGNRFLTGQARYVNDLVLPGMLHAAILRSPHAHARIRSIDLVAARRRSGVLLVATGQDLKAIVNPIPHYIDPAVFHGNTTTDNYPLAVERVIYAGQPVVAVVASSPHEARAALDDIVVDYELLPAVMDAEEALVPGAPLIHEHWGTNLILEGRCADGDVEGMLATAEHIIKDEIRIQRFAATPIETRGYIGHWDPLDESLTFYGSSQNPHPLRWALARIMGMSEARIRVRTPRAGGAFGLKMHGHPEEALVCALSRMLEQPVKWLEERQECFVIGGREQLHRFEVGFDNEGRILALRDELIANVGALGCAPGWPMPAITALAFPAGYRIQHCDVRYRIVTTNKGPWSACRGYGKEATTLVMERIISMIARQLKTDPAQVRRVNFIASDEFPYRTTGGLNIDSGDYHAAQEKLLATIGYDQLRIRQRELRQQGRYLGIGLAFEVTPEGGATRGTLIGGFDSSTVRMDPSGKVTVLTGITTPGGGNETGVAQIVADELGVALEDIVVVQGDTALCPYGFGNFSGRSTLVGGAASALAARDIRTQLATVAAQTLEVAPEDLVFHRGTISVAGGGQRSLSVQAVAEAIYTLPFESASSVDPLLESTRSYKPNNMTHVPDEKGRPQPYPSYSNAMHAAVIEVDTDTGQVKLLDYAVVHDCGTVINPALVEGQMQGAVVMGIGAALSERLAYDAEGHLVTDRFKTYLMARAGDLPDIRVEHQVTPSPFTLLGTKGAGEAGVGGGLAAMANAVDDALAPLGVTVRAVPLDPPSVLRLIQDARS